MDNYESIITDTGGCGPFQVFHAITTNIIRCLATWGIFMLAFGIYDPGWRCAKWSNDSLITNSSISSLGVGSSLSINTINLTSRPPETPKVFDGTCQDVHLCSEIEFDPDSRTFVTDFGLICDKSWILSLIMSVQFAGHAVGCVLSGFFADRFGRKLCLVVFFTLFAVLQVISALSTSWEWYGLTRFLIGISDGGILSSALMFSLEVLTERWRVITSMVPSTFISLIFLALVIFFERNWRLVQVTISLICLSLLIPFLFLPESPRWLLAKGRTEKAEKVVAKIAKMNRAIIPDLKPIVAVVDQNKQDKKYTFLHLFTEKSLRYNNIILTFIWILNVIAYFVLSLSVKAFSGDFYINLLISFTTELPLQMACCATVARFGRRHTCIFCLALASVSYFVLLASFAWSTEKDGGTVASIVFQIAKSLVSSVQSVVVLITAELSPTIVRVLSHSFFRFISRLASMAAPFLIPNGKASSYFVTFSMLSVFSVVTASLIYLLPETKGLDLSDKITRQEEPQVLVEDGTKKACSDDVNSTFYGSVSTSALSATLGSNSSDDGKGDGMHLRTIK